MEPKISKIGVVNSAFGLFRLKDVLLKNDAGDWGDEPVVDNNIGIIRSTNFTNKGVLNLSNVAHRTLKPNKARDKKLG